MLVDEGGAVLTEVVEDLEDARRRQYLFQVELQPMVEGIALEHIK